MGLSNKISFVAIIFLSVLSFSQISFAANTIVVNKTSPACTGGIAFNSSIQSAIDTASNGDTIVVCSGIYNENIVVNKPVSIISFAGPDVTKVNVSVTDAAVFDISSDNVTLVGFNITGAMHLNTQVLTSGIYVHSSGNLISNNLVTGNENGMQISGQNNLIKNNIASFNSPFHGI